MTYRLTAILAFVMLSLTAAAAERVDYQLQVKPLLKEHCYSCHGGLKQKGGLRLDTVDLAKTGGKHGPAIVARKPERSLLVSKITATDSSERMPAESDPLDPHEIELLKRWIREGAKSPADEKPESGAGEHWAFKTVVRPELPKSRGNKLSSANPVDAFINAELERRKLTPVSPAEKHVLLRRIYLDLVGLPPTRDELHAFTQDASRDAYERRVDRLLDDPRYGERWGRHWMDVWRYSDWFGRRQVPDVWNSAPQIWRWRDWIVRSLNTDKGYDRMVREMLAADEIVPEDDEAGVATGYLIRNWYALNHNQWMRDNVEHTGKAFLGLTFNCAHCHDHKYDPISQHDYFAFRAFFEPLYVRQDRWPGEADPGPFQDYSYSVLRKIQRLGAVRVFDKDLKPVTWFYTGGDERNRDTNRPPVIPSMPAVLGGDRLQLATVKLPPIAYYPGLKSFVQEEQLSKAQDALKKAETDLASLQKNPPLPKKEDLDRLAQAKEELRITREAGSTDAGALSGKQSLLIDATIGRRIVNHSLSGLKEVADGMSIEFKMKLVTDKHSNFQLAKDTTKGLTAAYVGFKEGKIRSYEPGGFKEFDAGTYVFTNRQSAFHVSLALEPSADRALLTVRSLPDAAVLVDKRPIAINGWNPVTQTNQAVTLDVQSGAVAIWDDVNVRSPAGEILFQWTFESPQFADDSEFVGVDGWSASSFCVAPAKSVISSRACIPGLMEKEQAMARAQYAVDVPELTLAAAEASVLDARAQLASVQARIAASRAETGLDAPADALPAISRASQIEREAALVAAKSVLASRTRARAEAESKPLSDTNRVAAVQTASKQLADAETAVARAQSAVADTKAATNYTRFGVVYPSESTGRRKALAEWMTARENPLTARVAVNHIWMRHFHEPIVGSVFDFGRNGRPPTHPELLDWLAAEFMESGWSMKHLHRLIVTSDAYKRNSSLLSSHTSRQAEKSNAADPENRYLWRMNPGRMEAEIIRDSVLYLAGTLDARMGGQELETKDMQVSNRRSVYFACYPEEGGKGEITAIFDAPDANECYRRTRSVVPQQALALTNSKLVHDQSAALTKRLQAEGGDFIILAYEQILGRAPQPAERSACDAFLVTQAQTVTQSDITSEQAATRARESLVRALLNHNDFLTIR